MSNTDPYDPTTYPTPAAGMAAVVPPLTLEQRVGILEVALAEHPALFAALRGEIASVRAALAAETTERLALAKHIAALEKEMADQTESLGRIEKKADLIETLLTPFKAVFSHQRVQTALVALALAVITTLTAWVTIKGRVAPASEPTITFPHTETPQ